MSARRKNENASIDISGLSIAVVVDDNVGENTGANVIRTHGLSLYIETLGSTVFFDLGPSDKVLEHNAEVLGLDTSIIDFSMISHAHSDHIGGLPYVGWIAPASKVYLPYGIGDSLIRFARKNGLSPIEVTDWTRVSSRIIISKPIYGPPWEHFLAIRHEEGLVLFTGCCHPGVSRIVDEAIEGIGDEVYCLIGGLHLSYAPMNIVINELDYVMKKVRILVPLHCSGERVREYALRKYGRKRVILAGAGSIVEL